jgi:hypothetical protein
VILSYPVEAAAVGRRLCVKSVVQAQDAHSTFTTLNRGSRSMWMFKTKPFGQVGSARRSATVLAVRAPFIFARVLKSEKPQPQTNAAHRRAT